MSEAGTWSVVDGALTREFVLKNFVAAVSFVKSLVPLAEAANHHPDILISNYRHVRIMLKTHSKNAVTEKDHALAHEIDALWGQM
jgi:4a-hydroxytetrahydrobiopterin dehydratase